MKDIVEQLKYKEILNDNNVLKLRNYISNKYPHLSSIKTSELFANSIHKILDDNIRHFDKEHRSEIRQALLRNSVYKSSFTLNAEEVFHTIINCNVDNHKYIDSLTDWINENQDKEISKASILEFIDEVEKYNKNNLIDNTCNVIEGLDFNTQNCIEKDSNEEILNQKINIEDKGLRSATTIIDNTKKSIKGKSLGIFIGVFLIALFGLTTYIKVTSSKDALPVKAENIEVVETRSINELPEEFKYKDIDVEKLREWLNSRDSKLADEPYLTTIVNMGKKFDINPLFLIAITGQEQGFVPRSHKYAEKIANNPFNVYGSWEKHNKDIGDSTKIAAITIVNLSKDRPSNIDAVKWINRKYAEDQNWHKGVSKIFYMLCKDIGLN